MAISLLLASPSSLPTFQLSYSQQESLFLKNIKPIETKYERKRVRKILLLFFFLVLLFPVLFSEIYYTNNKFENNSLVTLEYLYLYLFIYIYICAYIYTYLLIFGDIELQ